MVNLEECLACSKCNLSVCKINQSISVSMLRQIQGETMKSHFAR